MTAAAVGMAVGTAPAKAAQAKPATRRVAGPRPTVDGPAVEVGGNHRHAGPLAERERPDPGGRPLPDTVGRRLARVVGAQAVAAARVHTDRAADALAADNDAHAVTIGTDIFFAAGRYRPGTREGDWIIAHEVAHVAQAQRGLLDRPAFLAVAPSAPTPLEAAADQVADQLAAGPEEKPDEQQAPQPEGAPGAATADGVAQAPAGAPVADGGAALAQAGPETAGAPGPEPEAGPQPAATEAAPRADLPADLPRMPEPAVELSPAEQGRVGGVQQRAGAVTKANTAVPAAADNVATGTAAVQVPQQESDARAAGLLVDAVATKEKPSIEVEELCKRIRLLIAEKRPADEDAVVDTRPAQVAAEAGQGVATGVQQNVDATQASYGNLGTDPTGPAPAAAPGLEPLAPAEPTSPVAAAAATPDAVPPDQASLDEDTAAMAEKSRNAGLEKDAAQLVRSGPVAEAREAQGELGTLAADGPADALAAQQAALAKSDADLAALQAKAVASLQAARSGHVGGVADQQQALKEGSEGLRARLSARAEKAFTEAQDRVQELLSAVPQTAMGRWTAGLAPLTERFNTDLKVVKGKVEERHEGVSGFFVAGWDAVTGLPDWVKEAYDNAEKNFGDGVCTLILDISSYVNGIIKIADEIITTARTDITTIFTTDLPAEDQAWAAEQLKGFGTKLDALHERAESTRTSFTKELLENAGNAVQAAREKIQKLRKEAQGLWGRFLDAVGRFLDDPVKFIIDGLLEILGISPPAFWAVVDKIKKYAAAIVDAPIAFASNLMDGVAAGFQLFFDHIGTHLIEGLLEWLLSGLKQEGITIEIPKELSLRNVVVFFLQLLGLSWARIRKLLVEQLGEKAVAMIEKAAGVIATLATKGISGIFDDIEKMLEPKTIIDTIIDTAIRFISETLIVKVAEKIILLFNPVGAILAALEAIYRILKWIFTNAARIFHLIEAVVNGLGDVISGNVAGVAKTVEKALAMLVAPVIDFLADYLGLGGLPGKVATAVKGLQGWVEGVLRSVIKWLVEMGRKLLAKLGFGGKEDEKQKAAAAVAVGERVPFDADGEAHEVFIEVHGQDAVVMMRSTVTTVAQWLADRKADLSNKDTSAEAKAKGPDLIDKARTLAGLTDDAADTLRRDIVVATPTPEAAPSPEKLKQEQAAVIAKEHTLADVLQQIAILFKMDPPLVVRTIVVRSPLKLNPPVARQLSIDLATGAPSIYSSDTKQDTTLLKNLINAYPTDYKDGTLFKDGTLYLPTPSSTEISAARNLENLGQRIGRSTFTRRVALRSGPMGFSVDAGYDVLGSGVVTGRILTPKQRIEEFKALPDIAATAAATGTAPRFKPSSATTAPAYLLASKDVFDSALYEKHFESTEKIERDDAVEDLKLWLAEGAAGGLAVVKPVGAHLYVVVGGGVFEALVTDTEVDRVDSELETAVKNAPGILAFMRTMAKDRQVGTISWKGFVDELWKKSANREWLGNQFRDAHKGGGMHEWIPSDRIPVTIERASNPAKWLDGARWIDLHHALLTETSRLIFKPPTWWVKEPYGPEMLWVPHGHSGAVYIGTRPRNKFQEDFHDKLREALEDSTGLTSCINNVYHVFETWIWSTEAVLEPLYPDLITAGGTGLDPTTLASQQAKNFADIKTEFATFRNDFKDGAP